MGRPRQSRHDLPRRMYCDRGGVYYFWPLGKPKHWFRRPDRTPMTLGEALAAYGQLVDRPVNVTTIDELIDTFLLSVEFNSLAERTQADRRLHLAALRAAFGHYGVTELQTVDVLEWKQSEAHKAPRQWNQKLSALKVLLGYATDPLGLIEARDNPATGVKRMREKPRTRLPTAAEIDAFLIDAPDQLKLYVKLKMATGLRMSDLLRLDRRMIEADYLRTPIGKTGRVMRFLFRDETGASTGLRELIDQILELPQKVGSTLLFRTRQGRQYTQDGWQAMWQRRMAKYVAAQIKALGPEIGAAKRFTEHDIRATAGVAVEESQGREAARKLLGHTDQRTTGVYTGRGDTSIVPLKRPG